MDKAAQKNTETDEEFEPDKENIRTSNNSTKSRRSKPPPNPRKSKSRKKKIQKNKQKNGNSPTQIARRRRAGYFTNFPFSYLYIL